MAESILDIIFRTKKTGQGEKESISGLKGLASGFEQLTGVSIGVAGALSLASSALKFSVDAAIEGEKADAQLNAVLESTRGIAGMTADELDRLATSLSRTTAIDDELIKSGESVMLTFTKIGEQVFPDAMGAALDMSTALKQDLQSSVIQLGKALNDPINGVTALRRVGVSFTQDQMAMIRSLQETGDLMGAQKLILQELNTEFGGSAAAAADTYAGSLQKLQNNVENLAESFGSELLPALNDGVSTINTLVEWDDRIVNAMQKHDKEVQNTASSYEDYIAEMERAAKAAGFVTRTIDGQVVVLERGTSGTVAMSKEVQFLTEAEWGAAQMTDNWASAQMRAQLTTEQLIASQPTAADGIRLTAEAAAATAEPLNEMTGAFLLAQGAAQAAGQGSRELADAAIALAEAEYQLGAAQEDLAAKQQAWKEGVGGQMAGMLESAGIKGQGLYDVLAVLDQAQGTNTATAARQKDAMQALVDQYKRTGDLDAFRDGLKNLNDTFMPLDESIQKSTKLVEILQEKVDSLTGKTYWVTINTRVNGDLGDGGDGNNDNRDDNRDDCFLGGTLVSTPDGPRRIETVNLGDWVSVLEESGRLVQAQVEWKKQSVRADLVAVTLSDGQVIVCSPNHRWLTTDAEGRLVWQYAASLEQNTLLVSEKDTIWVRFVEEYPGTHVIYNFTIDHPEHTFLVGGVVVHNARAKATGGNLYTNQMYMAGEYGPELVQLSGVGRKAGYVYNAGQTAQMTGKVVIEQLHVHNELELETVLYKLANL